MHLKRRKAIALYLLLLLRRKRQFGVHPINKKRNQAGEFHKLMPDLKADPAKFRGYFRMGLPQFETLLELLHNK